MKLRSRLFIGLAAVVVAFAVTGLLVANTQRRFLTQQVDDQLNGAVPVAMGVLQGPNTPFGGGPPVGGAGFEQSLSELYVGHLDEQAQLTNLLPSALSTGEPLVVLSSPTSPRNGKMVPFTADGADGGHRFRVVRLADPAGGWAVVGLSLQRADDAYRRLLIAIGLAALAVLSVIGLTALWVVRLGIKPINDMAVAADAITGGDNRRRIATYPAGTEAQRLGQALNAMLDERQRADAQMRQFVSDASHELRTPLTSIRGYVDLIGRGGLREASELDDAMRRVSDEAVRMSSLVDDLLLLSKLDQERVLHLAAIDVAPLLHDAAADARAVQPDRPLTVVVAPDLIALADAERVRQVLAALVHNALVHTAPTCAIELVGSRTNAGVTIEVRDEGQGMDTQTAGRAFERFYRGDPSRSRHSGGSGLGLSIVQSIVEAHEGTITLASAPGEGCRVQFTLPSPSMPPSPRPSTT